MKLLNATLAGALGLAAVAPLHAADEAASGPWTFGANVAVTSDYIFRGVTQTKGNPALQGGLDVSHETGFYTGVWASKIDDDNVFGDADIEVDLSLGWSGEFDQASVDVGGVRYFYPDSAFNNMDTTEYHITGGYDFGVASASAGFSYSPDWYGANEAMYWEIGVDVPIQEIVTVSAHFGVSDFDDNQYTGYNDWSLGVSGEAMGVGLEAKYTGTSDIKDTDPMRYSSESRSGDRFSVTATKEF